uniref:Uncharacterized protein n=1 Tax=Acrobeloides nanus TaxID=290746 RepID=A0A914CZU7_9BILA
MLLVALQITVLTCVLLAAIFACRRVFCSPSYPSEHLHPPSSTADIVALNGYPSQSDSETGGTEKVES